MLRKTRNAPYGKSRKYILKAVSAVIAASVVFGLALKLTQTASRSQTGSGVISAENALKIINTGGGLSGNFLSELLGIRTQSNNEPADEPNDDPVSATPPAESSPTPTPSAPQSTEPTTAPIGEISNDEPIPEGSVRVINQTSLDPELERLFSEPLELNLSDTGPTVLIIHTHTSEAYTMNETYQYEPSDPYRTQDQTKNIVAVGKLLAEKLRTYGINVIHDTGVYDYPSYNGCYTRTNKVVSDYLEQYPSIVCVLDIHRDAGSDSQGNQFKTIAKIGDETCSQILFWVGSEQNSEHPNWRENLKFAMRLEYQLNVMYPSLCKPVYISKYRYNQHLAPQYLIVEVGAAGNTLEESLMAIDLFADGFAAVFK